MATPNVTPPDSHVLRFCGALRGNYAVVEDQSTGAKLLLHRSIIGDLAGAFARREDEPATPLPETEPA